MEIEASNVTLLISSNLLFSLESLLKIHFICFDYFDSPTFMVSSMYRLERNNKVNEF